jgi:hypothetical protein
MQPAQHWPPHAPLPAQGRQPGTAHARLLPLLCSWSLLNNRHTGCEAARQRLCPQESWVPGMRWHQNKQVLSGNQLSRLAYAPCKPPRVI